MNLISDLLNPEKPFHETLTNNIMAWRDEAEGTGDIIARRVVFGVAMAALSIAGLIDVIVCVALAVLTSPLLFSDYDKYPILFFHRATIGVLVSSFNLTLGQVTNIYAESFREVRMKSNGCAPHEFFMEKVASWRSQAENESDFNQRRIAYGIAMAALSVVGLVDIVATGALTIFTSPLLMTNYAGLPKYLAERMIEGTKSTISGLTVRQVNNIFDKYRSDDPDDLSSEGSENSSSLDPESVSESDSD